ncbi:MAG TPA: hypothetical protein VI434_02895 [Candidatus Dormibacteraeota bacterium]
MSAVPRHSEEELRQQWAFLDALVDRQAASLRSGNQDPEEDDVPVPAAPPIDGLYMEEISTLTRRVATLESERTTLLRRIDLAEEARMAAETARAAAEAAREAAEQALTETRARGAAEAAVPVVAAPVEAEAPIPAPAAAFSVQEQRPPSVAHRVVPVRKPTASKSRRRSWWQRFRE